MTIVLGIALLVEAATIALLRHRLGRRWLGRPVSLMILTSVAYQGLSPLLMLIPSTGVWDTYRRGIQQTYINSAMLIMAIAMFAFTGAYLLTFPERIGSARGVPDKRDLAEVLDWRLLAIACAPLAALTYHGRGYNNGGPSIGQGAALSTNLASEFFILLVLLTAFSFVIRRGAGSFIPVLIAQSLILAAAGERTPVVVDAIALMVLLTYSGHRVPRRQIRLASALTLTTLLAITGVRVEQGRALYHENSGLSARVAALGRGIAATEPGKGSAGPGLVPQVAVRLDGTDFAGGILQSVSFGQSRLSAYAVPESVLIVVPSVLWPSKLRHENALNPVEMEITRFGLQNVNFLPTLPGLYIGVLTPPWLVAFLAFLGLLAGRGERMLFEHPSPLRLVILAGAVTAALTYEQGLPGMLVMLRSALVVAMVVKAVEVAMAVRGRRSAAYVGNSRRSPTYSGLP